MLANEAPGHCPGDLIAYTAEEGVRALGEGKLLMSDSFPGQERSKLCMSSKVGAPLGVWLDQALCRQQLLSFCAPDRQTPESDAKKGMECTPWWQQACQLSTVEVATCCACI